MPDPCFEQIQTQTNVGDSSAGDISQSDLSPFVHKFQTARQKYVYDVNTKRIIRVSPVVWDIIEDYGRLDSRQIIAKHSAAHSEAAVMAAIKEVELTRKEKGLLLSIRPKKITPPSKEFLRENLDNKREQLILNVTEDCNFRCEYCVFGGSYQHFRTHSTGSMMTWDVARPAIDDFLAHSKLSKERFLSFYGGEPLLNLPLIKQSVAYVKQNYKDLKIAFGMTTNGSLLKGQAADFLAADNFLLTVSLDGPAAIHDRNRKNAAGKPTWAQIISNIREFLAAHPEYQINGQLQFSAVATRQTDLYEADNFWSSAEIFTDTMGLQISPQKLTGEKSDAPQPEDLLIKSYESIRRKFIDGLKSGDFARQRTQPARWVQTALCEKPFIMFHKRGYLSPHLPADEMSFLNNCIAGARRTFVSLAGDYFACERVVPSQHQLLGNIKEGMNLEKVHALLSRWIQSVAGQCRRCWCLPTCTAGCLATVGEDGQIMDEDKNKACAAHKRNMHWLLMEYCGILEENPKAFDYTASFTFQ